MTDTPIDQLHTIDHYQVERVIKPYSHIRREGIDIQIAIVRDTDNRAIMIRIYDKRFTEEPFVYGKHFFCENISMEEQDWLANIVAGALVDTIVSCTSNFRCELRKRFKSFIELFGVDI